MRYLMRHVFRCKRGKVPEVLEDAKRLEQALTGMEAIKNTRLSVDIVGDFDTLVFEGEVESLDQAFEGERAGSEDGQMQQLSERMNANTVSGHREVFEIVS